MTGVSTHQPSTIRGHTKASAKVVNITHKPQEMPVWTTVHPRKSTQIPGKNSFLILKNSLKSTLPTFGIRWCCLSHENQHLDCQITLYPYQISFLCQIPWNLLNLLMVLTCLASSWPSTISLAWRKSPGAQREASWPSMSLRLCSRTRLGRDQHQKPQMAGVNHENMVGLLLLY